MTYLSDESTELVIHHLGNLLHSHLALGLSFRCRGAGKGRHDSTMRGSCCTVYLHAAIQALVTVSVVYLTWPSYISCWLAPRTLLLAVSFSLNFCICLLYARQSGRYTRGAELSFFLLPAQWPAVIRTFPMLQSVQRVCSTPAPPDLIFDHLDPSSNASNMVICKAQSEVARDKVWWEVSDSGQPLSILAQISVAGVCIARCFR